MHTSDVELNQEHSDAAAAVPAAAATAAGAAVEGSTVCRAAADGAAVNAATAGDASQQVELSLEWLRNATPQVASAFLMSVEGMPCHEVWSQKCIKSWSYEVLWSWYRLPDFVGGAHVPWRPDAECAVTLFFVLDIA